MKDKLFIASSVILTGLFALAVENVSLDDPGLDDITSSLPQRYTEDGERIIYKDQASVGINVDVAGLVTDHEQTYIVLNVDEMRRLPITLRHAVEAHEYGHYLERHHIHIQQDLSLIYKGLEDPTIVKLETEAHCHAAVELRKQGFDLDTVHEFFNYISNAEPLEERSPQIVLMYESALHCYKQAIYDPYKKIQ